MQTLSEHLCANYKTCVVSAAVRVRVPLGVLSSPNFQAALVVSCFMGQSVSFGWLMWVIFPQQNMYLFHIIKCK